MTVVWLTMVVVGPVLEPLPPAPAAVLAVFGWSTMARPVTWRLVGSGRDRQ